MDESTKPASKSVSPAGEALEPPDSVTAVVVTDGDNEPAGVLEKWETESWIYCSADSLVDLN